MLPGGSLDRWPDQRPLRPAPPGTPPARLPAAAAQATSRRRASVLGVGMGPPALWGVLWQSDFFESSEVCKLLHS